MCGSLLMKLRLTVPAFVNCGFVLYSNTTQNLIYPRLCCLAALFAAATLAALGATHVCSTPAVWSMCEDRAPDNLQVRTVGVLSLGSLCTVCGVSQFACAVEEEELASTAYPMLLQTPPCRLSLLVATGGIGGRAHVSSVGAAMGVKVPLLCLQPSHFLFDRV